MRLRLALALLTGVLLANGAQAESNDMHILIGSYTHDSDSPGVLRLRFDPSQGRLEPEPLQALTSHNPPGWCWTSDAGGSMPPMRTARPMPIRSVASAPGSATPRATTSPSARPSASAMSPPTPA